MLVAAITRKAEIIEEIQKLYYSDYFYRYQIGMGNSIPDIYDSPEEGIYQYAIVDKDGVLVGYFDYRINWYSSLAHRFGLISFNKGDKLTLVSDVYNDMKKLFTEFKLHRIEYTMVGGNPVEKVYDKFCNKYNGQKLVIKDSWKNQYGNYCDEVIYSVINPDHLDPKEKICDTEDKDKVIHSRNDELINARKNRVIRSKNNDGSEVLYEYDENGNEIHYKDSYGFEEWKEYDDKGNKIYCMNMNGDKQWYEYDERGNEIHYIDNDGYEEWNKYNNDGDRIFHKVANGKVVSGYDKNNKLIYHKDSNGHEEWYEYDEDGKRILIYNK